MIKCNNVIVRFGEQTIKFPNKEFLKNKISIITGPNGSGKTTILKSLAKLQSYEGDIHYEGVSTFTAQTPIMFNMSVRKNIEYPLQIRGLNIEDYNDKINHYSTILGLNTLLEKNAQKLSSGEKMKISIIRSIIFEPDILLLDEPTTALDVDSINALTRLLQEIKSTMTIIMASHDRVFIKELADDTYKLGGTYV